MGLPAALAIQKDFTMELVARNTEGRARQHTGYCVERVSKRNASNQVALAGPCACHQAAGACKALASKILRP